MRCPSCGKSLPENVTFCTECGAKLTAALKGSAIKSIKSNFGSRSIDNGIKMKDREKKPRNKNRLWIIAGVLFAVIAIGTAACLLFMNRGLKQFKSAVKEQEISSAMQHYNELALEDRMKANAWLREYLQALENDYYNEDHEYTEARARMEDLCQFDSVRADAAKALKRIDFDNNATIAYKKAQQYAEDGKWQQAYESLAELNIAYRNYDEAAAFRSECAKKYKEAVLSHCEALEAEKDYQEIISSLLSAMQIHHNDADLVLALQDYADEFEDATLSDAAKLAQEGKYSEAIEVLTIASDIWEADSFSVAIDDYYRAIEDQELQALKANCEEKYRESGAEAVLKLLNSMDPQTKFDDDRMLLLSEYQQKYVDEVLESASAKADARDFEGAISLLQNARNTYDASEFQQAISGYEEYLPIDLTDCHCIDASDYFSKTILANVEDQFGHKYDRAICWENYAAYRAEQSIYAVFFLDKKYISLRGTLAPRYCDSGESGYICIYLDGEMAYESPIISCTTEPFEFNVDVSGCSQMRLELHHLGNGGYWDSFGILVSAKLS